MTVKPGHLTSHSTRLLAALACSLREHRVSSTVRPRGRRFFDITQDSHRVANAIYVNMVVQDLERSKKFYEALGYSFNEQFTNEDAAGLVISDTIYAMLHTTKSFQRFTQKPIADATTSNEVLLAIELDSRAEVDRIFEAASVAGGAKFRETEDLGFMYTRSFSDPDGHVWEPFFMDMTQMPT